jgi:hypothetical protein
MKYTQKITGWEESKYTRLEKLIVQYGLVKASRIEKIEFGKRNSKLDV